MQPVRPTLNPTNYPEESSMRMSQLVSLFAAGLCAVSALALAADMTVVKESIAGGDGNAVKFQGNPLPLSGKMLKVGDPLPSVTLTGAGLAPVNLADIKGKVRIISIVPSLDTPVCEEQTHRLSEKNAGLAKQVELVTVSMDLPFAQGRFAKEAKIKNVTFLSDYKSGELA